MTGYNVQPPLYSPPRKTGMVSKNTEREDENELSRRLTVTQIVPELVQLGGARARGKRSGRDWRKARKEEERREAIGEEEGVEEEDEEEEEQPEQQPESRKRKRGTRKPSSTSKTGWKRSKPGQSLRTVTNRREAFGKTYSAFVKNDPEYPHRIIEGSIGLKIEYDSTHLERKGEAWNHKHLKPLQARLLLGEALMRFYDELECTPMKRRNVGPNTFQWLVAGDIDVNSGSMMGKRMGEGFFIKHGLSGAKHRDVFCQVMRDLGKWETKGNVLFQHLGLVVPEVEG